MSRGWEIEWKVWMKFFSAMCIMYIVGKQLYWKTSRRQGKHLVNLLSVIDFGTFPSNNMTVLMVRINSWINIYIFLRSCRFLCRLQFEQNFLCDFAYCIYTNHQPEKCFVSLSAIILNLKMMSRWHWNVVRFLISVLFFTCFFIQYCSKVSYQSHLVSLSLLTAIILLIFHMSNFQNGYDNYCQHNYEHLNDSSSFPSAGVYRLLQKRWEILSKSLLWIHA